jgi:SAM-dependent methyltransferase
MATTTIGSANAQSELWGPGARAWAEVQEPAQAELYAAVLDRLDPAPEGEVLDVGCGAGVFTAQAVGRGLSVTGIDATSELIEHARRRVPAARFDVGEIESLPYADGAFDLVTGFNSFQYAAAPTHALREARRVIHPDGRVVAVVWGDPAHCEATGYLKALGALLPPPPPGTPGPFALSEEGALARLLHASGLHPIAEGDVDTVWEYPDLETALRGLLAAGPAFKAITVAGEDEVRDAIGDALTAFRRSDGRIRLENRWRYVVGVSKER